MCSQKCVYTLPLKHHILSSGKSNQVINYKYSIKLTHMRYLLQYFSKLFLRNKRTNKFKPVIIPQELSTRNKWLYPDDNYGKLERGVE
jgi:hypothetical protein